jgi:hypothetical protein
MTPILWTGKAMCMGCKCAIPVAFTVTESRECSCCMPMWLFLEYGRGRLCEPYPLTPQCAACASTAADAIAERMLVLGTLGRRSGAVPGSEKSSEVGVDARFKPEGWNLKSAVECQSLLLLLLAAGWSQEVDGDMCMGLAGAEKAVPGARLGAEAAGVAGAKSAERSGRVVSRAAELVGEAARFLVSLCAGMSMCSRPAAALVDLWGRCGLCLDERS